MLCLMTAVGTRTVPLYPLYVDDGVRRIQALLMLM